VVITSLDETTAADRQVRTLRWAFRRRSEVIVTELSLTVDHSAYEVRIHPPWNPAGIATERFDDVASAFERQANIECILIEEGWTLESFDSNRL
jgi:hypothetical protein